MRFLLTVAFCVFPLTVFAQDEVVEVVSDETPKQEVVEEVADATPATPVEATSSSDAVIPPRCSTNCATLSRVVCMPVKLVKRVVCHTRTRIRGCSLFRRPLRRCCR